MKAKDSESVLLLGRDNVESDAWRLQGTSRSVCAISPGNEQAQAFKGPRDILNEDAALLIDAGPATLLAVADAHFGPESSHEVLQRILENGGPIPSTPRGLRDAVLATRDTARKLRHGSETTLLIAVLDRESDEGFGLSFGDSSLVICTSDGAVRRLNPKTRRYISPCQRSSYGRRYAAEFRFPVEPGCLLLAFTDGVDECHYGRPATSIQEGHIGAQWQASKGDLTAMTEGLVQLALRGIEGFPGGEDNIAVVATIA